MPTSNEFSSKFGYATIFGNIMRSIYDDEKIKKITEEDKFEYNYEIKQYINQKMDCINNDIILEENTDFSSLADIILITGDYSRSMELVQLVLDNAEPRSVNYTRAEELFGQIRYTKSAG